MTRKNVHHDSLTDPREIKVTCENGHIKTMVAGWFEDRDIQRVPAWYWTPVTESEEFDLNLLRVHDDYRRTHGGCCQRAASDAVEAEFRGE